MEEPLVIFLMTATLVQLTTGILTYLAIH